MAATGRVKAWKTIFDNNQVLPVAFDRQKDGADGSIPFCFGLKSVDGIPPKVSAEIMPNREGPPLGSCPEKLMFPPVAGFQWIYLC